MAITNTITILDANGAPAAAVTADELAALVYALPYTGETTEPETAPVVNKLAELEESRDSLRNLIGRNHLHGAEVPELEEQLDEVEAKIAALKGASAPAAPAPTEAQRLADFQVAMATFGRDIAATLRERALKVGDAPTRGEMLAIAQDVAWQAHVTLNAA